MNTTTSIRNRITAAATVAVGAGAIAIGALAFSAPALAAGTIQQTCEQSPGMYAAGATLGVYTKTDYGYYKLTSPVTPPPVLSAR